MYVCIYLYMYVCMYVLHTYIHTYIVAHIHRYIHIYIHASPYIYQDEWWLVVRQHVHASSGLHNHYSKLFTWMTAL